MAIGAFNYSIQGNAKIHQAITKHQAQLRKAQINRIRPGKGRILEQRQARTKAIVLSAQAALPRPHTKTLQEGNRHGNSLGNCQGNRQDSIKGKSQGNTPRQESPASTKAIARANAVAKGKGECNTQGSSQGNASRRRPKPIQHESNSQGKGNLPRQ